MSEIVMTKIVLSGPTWLPNYSLYLRFNAGNGDDREYLYELQTDDILAAQPGRQEEERWNVFVSSGKVPKTPRERKRKLRWADLSYAQAVQAIREDVIKNRQGYEVLRGPPWWAPLPKGQLEEVGPCGWVQPKNSDAFDRLDNAYEDDDFLSTLVPANGRWARAHFWSHATHSGRIRFSDARQRNEDGIFLEHTEAMSLIGTPWSLETKQLVHDLHGTILEGVIFDREAFGPIDDLLAHHGREGPKGALGFQVMDCLQVKATPILDKMFKTRLRYAQEIVKRWHQTVPDAERRERMLDPDYKTGISKLDMRARLMGGNQHSILMKYRSSIYTPFQTNGLWLIEHPAKPFTAVVTGFEDAKVGRHAAKGWIGSITLGLYTAQGLQPAGKLRVMPDAHRQYISENKERVLGSVVEVRAEMKTSSGVLVHPRFVAFRDDVKPEDCK